MDDVYYEAASILWKLETRQKSFRNLIFDSKGNKKLLYKICIETMKRKRGFEQILAEIPSLKDDVAFSECYSPFTQYVLLYEYLFGHGLKKCYPEWKKVIERHTSHLSRLKNEVFISDAFDPISNSIASSKDHASVSTAAIGVDEHVIKLPRYARVNTLKTTAVEVKEILCSNGWRFVEIDVAKRSRKGFRKLVDNLAQYDFCFDPHISELVIFACGTDLHEEQLVIDGYLLLQDKSSCLPPICLECQPGAQVLDMCAAPGMKTSHIAALLQNEGKIFAFDMNFERFKLMEDILYKAGVECAEIKCCDVLRQNFSDKLFQKVKYVLLDPPCSGSGMVKRLDFLTNDNECKDGVRLKKLANLQSMMLKHALTLPSLHRLVYSTCSLYEEENEQVVQEVLESVDNEQFRLLEAFPKWKHRGLNTYEFGPLCLRSSPKKDRTNGFFVAVFERII